MQRTFTVPTLAVGFALALTATSNAPAFAKGGQDNFERQAQLQEELRKARDSNAQHRAEPASGLFDLLFGQNTTDTAQGTATPKAKTKTE